MSYNLGNFLFYILIILLIKLLKISQRKGVIIVCFWASIIELGVIENISDKLVKELNIGIIFTYIKILLFNKSAFFGISGYSWIRVTTDWVNGTLIDLKYELYSSIRICYSCAFIFYSEKIWILGFILNEVFLAAAESESSRISLHSNTEKLSLAGSVFSMLIFDYYLGLESNLYSFLYYFLFIPFIFLIFYMVFVFLNMNIVEMHRLFMSNSLDVPDSVQNKFCYSIFGKRKFYHIREISIYLSLAVIVFPSVIYFLSDAVFGKVDIFFKLIIVYNYSLFFGFLICVVHSDSQIPNGFRNTVSILFSSFIYWCLASYYFGLPLLEQGT